MIHNLINLKKIVEEIDFNIVSTEIEFLEYDINC